MSKVRVIFEFEHVSHDEKTAGNDSVEVHEKIGVDVKTERDTDNRPTSLCDVYASILQYHSPVSQSCNYSVSLSGISGICTGFWGGCHH